MKKQSGITLIALIVTVLIVLFLAAITVSLTTGSNGVISQASNAAISKKEASAKEELSMAWTSTMSKYWADWSKDPETRIEEYLTKAKIDQYLTGGVLEGEPVNNFDGTYTLNYKKGDDVYTLTVDAEGNPIDGEHERITLVGSVALGDYVEIGVPYTCQQNSGYTGWRVIDDGTTNGRVELVSAGCPLNYYYNPDSWDDMINSRISWTLTCMDSPLPTDTTQKAYFTSSGFEGGSFDVESLFEDVECIDKVYGHVNLEKKYKVRSIIYLNVERIPASNSLVNIGKDYWIEGHFQTPTGKMDYMASNGTRQYAKGVVKGIRLTAYLKARTVIADDNTGDGSAERPYKLAVKD